VLPDIFRSLGAVHYIYGESKRDKQNIVLDTFMILPARSTTRCSYKLICLVLFFQFRAHAFGRQGSTKTHCRDRSIRFCYTIFLQVRVISERKSQIRRNTLSTRQMSRSSNRSSLVHCTDCKALPLRLTARTTKLSPSVRRRNVNHTSMAALDKERSFPALCSNYRLGPFLLTCIIYFPNAPNTCAPRLRVVLVALSGNPRAFRISSKYCRAGLGSPPTRAVNEPLVCFLIAILSST